MSIIQDSFSRDSDDEELRTGSLETTVSVDEIASLVGATVVTVGDREVASKTGVVKGSDLGPRVVVVGVDCNASADVVVVVVVVVVGWTVLELSVAASLTGVADKGAVDVRLLARGASVVVVVTIVVVVFTNGVAKTGLSG